MTDGSTWPGRDNKGQGERTCRRVFALSSPVSPARPKRRLESSTHIAKRGPEGVERALAEDEHSLAIAQDRDLLRRAVGRIVSASTRGRAVQELFITTRDRENARRAAAKEQTGPWHFVEKIRERRAAPGPWNAWNVRVPVREGCTGEVTEERPTQRARTGSTRPGVVDLVAHGVVRTT